MKTILPILLLGLLAANLRAAPPEPLTGAVLDFAVSGKKLEDKGPEAALLLNAKLAASENLLLVERQELKKVLGEQELGLSGTVDPASVAKIGHLVGAKALITGRVFESGSKVFIVAKVMSTETGRVFGESVTIEGIEGLEAGIATLAGQIDATVKKRAGDLVAKVETDEEAVERLKKLIPAGDKPTVSVSVAEQHLAQPVIDPAVETELKSLLPKLGYEVIGAESGKTADVVVKGEAFSEFAARYGNLVACRARVEITVHRRTDDRLLLTARATASAADIAEHVAGKEALAKCARILAAEILPKLSLK